MGATLLASNFELSADLGKRSERLPEKAQSAMRPTECEPPRSQFIIDAFAQTATDVGIAGFVIEEPGTYTLSRDIVLTGVDVGILVLADNVVLDLAGQSITDPAGTATLIHAEVGQHLTIREGELGGGRRGIVARGARPSSQLLIKHVGLRGVAMSSVGIDIDDVHDVRVLSLELEEWNSAVRVSSYTLGLIAYNKIRARSVGIETGPASYPIEIKHNVIDAPEALLLRDRTIVEDNLIRSEQTSGPSVRLSGGYNRFSGNMIESNGATCAVSVGFYGNTLRRNNIRGKFTSGVCLEHLNVVEHNRIVGAGQQAVKITGGANRVAQNLATGSIIGISVEGPSNLIEGNDLRGRELQCGIRFTASQNVYRGNRVMGAAEEVCGEPNTRAEVVSLNPERSLSARFFLGRRGDRDGECTSGNARPISRLEKTTTPLGTAGLVIDEPGEYIATENLVVPDDGFGFGLTFGILILASDVSLDLGSHAISAAAEPFSMIYVTDGQRIVLRNGAVSGGVHALVVNGDQGSDDSGLILEGVTVAGLTGLETYGIDQLEIEDSHIVGGDAAAVISGGTTGRIIASRFEADKRAFWAPDFRNGEVVSSHFRADNALRIGSENDVRMNYMEGTTFGFSLSVGNGNLVVGNQFFGDELVLVEGSMNVISGNIFRGNLGVAAVAGGNMVLENLLTMGRGTGIRSRGTADVVRNNFIINSRCGIVFPETGGVYSGNVVVDSDEGACGVPGTNEGGNVFPRVSCGNGVQSVEEYCDGGEFAGKSCQSEGFEGGWLTCNSDCSEVGLSNCSVCGDGVSQGFEECDGSDVEGWDCEAFGYDAGTLGCVATCEMFDFTGCTYDCGNDVRSGTEVCDGTDLVGATCQSEGFEKGILACSASCDGFDTSSCSTCGNGDQESDEVCDGDDLSGMECAGFGFETGQLSCAEMCSGFIITECTSTVITRHPVPEFFITQQHSLRLSPPL